MKTLLRREFGYNSREHENAFHSDVKVAGFATVVSQLRDSVFACRVGGFDK